MKPSRFLILVNTPEGGTLAWSAYTGALAKVNREFLDVIDSLNSGGDVLKDSQKSLLQEMIRCGFAVDDEVNELERYNELIQHEKQRQDTLKLVIAPTLNCNFACPYCFETCRDVNMSADVQDAVIYYVRKKLESGAVKSFSVVWYGGEPLLELGIIAALSKSFIEICRACKVRYYSSIITNGYLINETAAKILKECCISSAQVTIDGRPEVHNMRRVLRCPDPDSQGTYKRIIEGINFLGEAEISTSIRMNIDKDNAGELEEIISRLSVELHNKKFAVFSPGQVVHYGGESPACLTKKEYSIILLECMRLCREYDLPFSRKASLPKLRASYCTAALPYSFVIDPEGLVYKCWNDIGGKSYSIGTVNELCANDLAEAFESSQWGKHNQLNAPACRECRILPVCAGGCPREAVHFGKTPECECCKYILDDMLIFQAGLKS